MTAYELARMAWAQAWQLSVLIILVAGAGRLWSRRRPHLVHALWLVVLAKCLTPPLWSSPGGLFCRLQLAPPVVSSNESPPRRAEGVSPLKLASTTGDPGFLNSAAETSTPAPAPDPLSAGRVVDESADEIFARPSEAPAISLPPRKPASTELVAAGVLWLTGSAVLIAVAFLRAWLCLRAVRRDGVENHSELQSHVAQLARRLKIRRQIKVLVTAGRVGPAVVGILRPTILLPAAIVRGRRPEELDPILAHELLHVRRGDLWVGLVQVLAHAAWWFHPLVWLANRLATRAAEACCDEEVLAELGCEPAQYAHSLLDVLELKRRLIPVPAFPGVRPVDVTRQRLERIMQLEQGCRKRTPWWCWLAMLAVAAVTLPGAAYVALSDSETVPAPDADRADPPRVLSGLGDDSRTTTRSYDVRALLDRLRSVYELNGEEARTALENWVRGWVAGGPPKSGGEVAWLGQRLVVEATAKRHTELAQFLESIERVGFHQIVVETTMLSAPVQTIEALCRDWKMTIVKPGTRGAADRRAGSLEIVAKNPTRSGRSPLKVEALYHVDALDPVWCSVFDEQQAARLREKLKERRELHVLAAPKVTMWNGAWASIEAGNRRPFVVGRIEPASREFEPEIRVVPEGWSLQVRPLLRSTSKLALDCALHLTEIRSVETRSAGVDAENRPVEVQAPEVATMRVNASAEVEVGGTIAIASPTTGRDAEGRPMALLVLMRADTIPMPRPEAVAPRAAPPASLGPVPRALPKRLAARAAPRADQDAVPPVVGIGVNSDAGVTGSVVVAERKPEATAAATDKSKYKRPEHRKDVVEKMNRSISIHFDERPLRDVMSEFSKQIGMNILIDQAALAEEGVTDEAPVTINVDDVSARSVLSLILEPLKLTHVLPVLDDNSVIIKIVGRNPGAALITVNYSVADLVLPAPSLRVGIPEGKKPAVEPAKPVDASSADFTNLIELITSTIQPESWEEVGGPGMIREFRGTLSLVIRQNQAVHDEIADLLSQLRRLQDLQAMLNTAVVVIPARATLKELGLDGDPRVADEGVITLTPEQAAKFGKAAHELRGTTWNDGPRLTLINGQGAEVGLARFRTHEGQADFAVQIVPAISADRRFVRLSVAAGAATALEALARAQTVTVRDQHSVLLDITETLQSPRAAGLRAGQGTEVRKRPDPRLSARVLLLVTPQIVVQEEEEELLGVER